MSAKKLFIQTLGCAMNVRDSEHMIAELTQKENYALTEDIKEADLILINTCSVREKPVHKLFSEVGGFEKVKKEYFKMLAEVARIYAGSMNIIHYMHDKYAYEASQMALHDTDVHRYMAYGVAGLSVACDSLSAIKYAKVKQIRNEDGIAVDFEIEGEFPKYGNDDDRVDDIAKEILEQIHNELAKHKTYRDAEVTM